MCIRDSPTMERTSEYKMEFAPGEFDFREVIHPKKDFREVDTEFIPQPYYQVFEPKLGFLPNLSIIDPVSYTHLDFLPDYATSHRQATSA